MTAAGITAKVVAAVRGPLADLGFAKRSGEIFTCSAADGVLGWLGLNRAYRAAEATLEVNAVIGVRNQEVERLVAELRGQKVHAYLPPTVSSPLSYLMPEGRYRPWLFHRDVMFGDVAADLALAVGQYGLPFVSTGTEFAGLSRLLAGGRSPAHQAAYRQPVALLLAGDRAAAERSLDTALAEMGDRSDAAATEFRSFAEQLRRLVVQ